MKKTVIGIVAKPLLNNQMTRTLWTRLVINDEFRKIVVENNAIPIGIMPDRYFGNSDTSGLVEEMTEDERNDLLQVVSMVDGIILQGGLTSDTYEMEIVKYAITNNLPIIGICAGFNNIARAVGLPLVVKDSLSAAHDVYDKDYRHTITINSKHPYAALFNTNDDLCVNSLHTVFLERTGANENISILAEDMDGNIEAFTVNDTKFCLAIKWHPEIMSNNVSRKIFEEFVLACAGGCS